MGYIIWSILETKTFDHYMAEKFEKCEKMKKHEIMGRSLLFKIGQNRFQILDWREILCK